MTEKKYYKERPINFYLGDKTKAAERKAKLKAMADEYGVSASKLIQMLADGEFERKVPRPDKTA